MKKAIVLILTILALATVCIGCTQTDYTMGDDDIPPIVSHNT